MIFLLIGVFIAIIFFEVPDLIRNKHWPELIVFSILLAIGFIMTSLQTLGFNLPMPIQLLDVVIRDVLHLNYE